MRSAWILGLVGLVGCAASGPRPSVVSERTDVASSLRRQLAGHLERARGCFGEARLRDPNASGLVRVGFTIEPDGRVDDVSVDAWSRDEELLAACVRSRVSSLFFDPAPPREAVRVDRTFYFCPDEQGGLCRLGGARPLGGEASEDLLDRIDAGLAARDDRLEACAREIGGRPAVLDVRLEVGTDGRVMSGQLRESFPASTGLRRCAVGPLLGARVEGALPDARMQVRYVYRLGAVGDVRSARR